MTDLGDRGRSWLARVLAGELVLPVIQPAVLPRGERAPIEHCAATRAAACPDIFVAHADPGAGERFISEVAAATRDRVLVLSPNPAAADRITERLLRCGVAALRALGEDENPARPSPAVSRATSAALGVARAAQARAEAAAEVAAAEARVAAFASVSKALARLAEVTEAQAQGRAELAERAAQCDRTEADVRAETDTPFAHQLATLEARHAETAAALGAELAAATAARDERAAALEQARHLHAEALRKPGFLSRLFSGKTKPGATEPADLEKQLHALEADATALADQVRELQAAWGAAEAAHTAERDGLVGAELAARRAASAAAVAAAEAELARMAAEAAALNKVISAAVPEDDYATAVRALAAARDRARAAEPGAHVPARVVVGTPGSLGADPVFAGPPHGPPFGLLVLDRAEELSEAEFARLTRLAERYLLVGHAPTDERPHTGRGRGPDAPFAVRVARQLDCEPWGAEGNRFVCRLVPLGPDQRRALAREPLADRPEIELRFVDADGDPQLAEIAFPAAMSAAEAKRFLVHALGEVRLRPCGECHWTYAADALVATWPAADAGPDGAWIDLEPGVRELVTGAGPFAFTAAVSFDPAVGWDAERAAAWLDARLPAPPTSRFAVLPRSSGPRGG